MQTSQFTSKKGIWRLLLVAAAFMSLSISSCIEKPPKGSCISLSKSKIEKAWGTLIKDGKIDHVSFITFYNPINHDINVSVQAFTKVNDTTYKPIGPFVKLLSESGCANLLPKLRVGQNIATLEGLGILTESGRDLSEFGYLALKPFADRLGNLAYTTNVVDKNNKVLAAAAPTLPCPPCVNCRPPCADDCSPPCTKEEEDSVFNNSSLNKNIINDSLNKQ